MTSPQPDPLAHPGRFADLYTFRWTELHFTTSLITAVAVAVALVGGVAFGHPSAGLIVGGGAMTVGFGLNQRIADSRLWPMIWATLSMAASTFIGMFAGHRGFGVVLAGAVWAFAYGVLTARAAGVAWVGQQAAVFLLVTSAFPADAWHAFQRALLTVLGGTLQIACTSLFLKLLPELRQDLAALPRYGLTGAEHLRHTLGWRRVLRRLRGFPRALPRLRASETTGYALRLAITVGLACEVYRRLGVQSGYWIPMTALLVQKPAFAETLNRALMRVGGTLAGAVFSTFVLLHTHPDPILLAWLASLFCFCAYMTNAVNYGLFAVFLTSYIVFLLSLNALPGPEIAHRRAYATLLGGVIALLIHLDALRRRRGMVAVLTVERP